MVNMVNKNSMFFDVNYLIISILIVYMGQNMLTMILPVYLLILTLAFCSLNRNNHLAGVRNT